MTLKLFRALSLPTPPDRGHAPPPAELRKAEPAQEVPFYVAAD